MSVSEINSTKKNYFFNLQNTQESINKKTKINYQLLDKLPYSMITSLSDITYKLGTLTYFAWVPMVVPIARKGVMSLGYGNIFSTLALAGAAISCAAIGLSIIKYHCYFDNPLQEYIDTRTLRISHEEKNKPSALIIEATEDHNGAFSEPRNRLFRYGNFLKHYKVHRVRVSEINGFKKAIEEVGKIEKISLLWIKGHGSPEAINLGPNDYESQEVTKLNPQVLKMCEGIFKTFLDKNAITLLQACSTGRPLNDGDNFACTFSKYAPGQVYAAKMDSNGVSFSPHNIPSLKGGFFRKDITVVYENGKLV